MKLTIEHFYTEALKRILMNVREISINLYSEIFWPHGSLILYQVAK